MIEPTEMRHAVATMAGGALLSVALGLDDVAPGYVGIAVVVPALLGFGVIEIYGRYGERYGSMGRAGVILTGGGLGLLLVAILVYAVVPPVFFAVFLVAVPGIPAIVMLALGSLFLAIPLYDLGVLRAPAAVLLGIGVPIAPFLTVLITGVGEPGTFFGPVLPVGVLSALAGVPYGVGWMLVGHRLRKTTGAVQTGRIEVVQRSPHPVTAGLVGGAFVLLNVGRFVPMGPLSSTPWVDQSGMLDVAQLVVGTAGLVAAARRDDSWTRSYNQVVGLLSLLIVALTAFATTRQVRSLGWFPVALLELGLPGILFHLAAGVVLLIVGFGVDRGSDTE